MNEMKGKSCPFTSLDYIRSENMARGQSGRNQLFGWILQPGLPDN
jgi:hypothetical protein